MWEYVSLCLAAMFRDCKPKMATVVPGGRVLACTLALLEGADEEDEDGEETRPSQVCGHIARHTKHSSSVVWRMGPATAHRRARCSNPLARGCAQFEASSVAVARHHFLSRKLCASSVGLT